MHDVLLEELEDELLAPCKIILIPAPLSPSRFRSRGYNQAEELARQIALLNPDQFEVRTDLIKKTKNTPTQVSIRNRDKRLANLKNAFALSKEFSPPDLGLPTSLKLRGTSTRGLVGKVVVIIDDVSTTGATINEIRQLLTRAGARHVYGLVVAHG